MTTMLWFFEIETEYDTDETQKTRAMFLYGSWGLRDSNLVHDQQLVLLWIFPPHSSAVFLMSESKSYSIDNNNKVWQVFFKIGLFWLYFVQLFQKKSTTNWVWQCFTNSKSETAFRLKSLSDWTWSQTMPKTATPISELHFSWK